MDSLCGHVDHPWLLLLAIAIAIPVLFQYFKWFFGDVAGLRDDAVNVALPDWLALLMGRFWQGEWAVVKIGAFILLVAGFTAALYKIGVMIFF